jgi:hypothetical protein
MPRSVLRLAVCFVLAPPLLGGLAAGYEIAMFRLSSFQPELRPLHVDLFELVCAFVAGTVIAWLTVAAFRRGRLSGGQGSMSSFSFVRLVSAALAAVFFLAAGWRTLVVEGAIVQQFGYCCCCESKPSWQHTVNAVFNPSRF